MSWRTLQKIVHLRPRGRLSKSGFSQKEHRSIVHYNLYLMDGVVHVFSMRQS
jgi:hypothetical protein